jgi:hypothetical protein
MLVGGFVVLTIIGLFAPDPPKDSSAHGSTQSHAKGEAPPGVVTGSMDTGGADGELKDSIHVDQVWCGWSRGHVRLHVRFQNASVEDLTVDYNTRYKINNGGTHGDSLTNTQSTDVDGGETRVVTVDAGTPDGVDPGAAISDCEPEMKRVDTQ